MRRTISFLFWLSVAAVCFYFCWWFYDNRGRDDTSKLIAISRSPGAKSHLAHTWRLENPSGGSRSGRISIVVRTRRGPNTEEEGSEYGPRHLERHEGEEEFVLGSVDVDRDCSAKITTELLNIDPHSDSKIRGRRLQLRAELNRSGDDDLPRGETMSLAGDNWRSVSSTANRDWKSGELDLYKVMTVSEDRLWIYDVFLRRDE